MKSVLDGRPALKKEVDKVAEVAGYLWQKGWAERNGGNITVNVTELVDDEIFDDEDVISDDDLLDSEEVFDNDLAEDNIENDEDSIE